MSTQPLPSSARPRRRALRSLQSPVDTEWGAPLTGLAIAAIPLVILFVIASRQLIAGLTAGAVK